MAGASSIDPKDLSLLIKGLVSSRPTIAKASVLQRECEVELGLSLAAPIRQLGFETFVDFLRSIPLVVQLGTDSKYNPDVYPVKSEKSGHIDQLIAKQRIAPSRRRGSSLRPRRRTVAVAPPRSALRKPDQSFDSRDIENRAPNRYNQNYQNVNVYKQSGQTRNEYRHSDSSRNGFQTEQQNDTVYSQEYKQGASNYKDKNCIPAGLEDDSCDDYDDWADYDDSESEMAREVFEKYGVPDQNEAGSASRSEFQNEERSKESALQTSRAKLLDQVPYDSCDISNKMKNNFRVILEKHPEGIWATELEKLYHKCHGVRFDIQDLGYSNVMDLVDSLPSVFSYRREGTHDWKLYDVRHVTQQSLDALGEIVESDGKYIPQSIIDKIKKLLKNYTYGFRSGDLLQLYEDEYKQPLDLSTLGYESVESFLENLTDDIKLMKSSGYYLILPKHERLSQEALEPPKPDEQLNTLTANECGYLMPDNIVRLGEEVPKQWLPPLKDTGPNDPLLELEVRVAEVMSPAYFYISLGNYHEQLETLMDDLHKFYEWEEKNYMIPLPLVVPNLFCATKYQHYWHRAKVIKIFSPDSVQIEYIDYGTPAKVNYIDLRFLSKNFAYLPSQAFCAKLCGIKPKEGETKFSPEACAEFLRIVTDRRMVAHVYQVSERVKNQQEKIQLEMILYDVENPKAEIVINDFLVRRGLVAPIVPEVEDSSPSDPLPGKNILLENIPPTLLSEPTYLQQDDSSSLDKNPPLVTTSSKPQERRLPIGPPPGFGVSVEAEADPNFHFLAPPTNTSSFYNQPSANCLSSDDPYVYVNNYLMNTHNAYQPHQPYPSIPGSMVGQPLYRGHPAQNKMVAHPQMMYPVPYPNMNELMALRDAVMSGSVTLLHHRPPNFMYYGGAPPLSATSANMQRMFIPPQPQHIPAQSCVQISIPPQPQHVLAQSRVQISTPPPSSPAPSGSPHLIHTPTHRPPPIRPTPPPSPQVGGLAPSSAPEWRPTANFTESKTTGTVSGSQSLFSGSPTKTEAPEACHIPRPATPLTPVSMEIASVCKLSRPNSSGSQVSDYPSYSSPSKEITPPVQDIKSLLNDAGLIMKDFTTKTDPDFNTKMYSMTKTDNIIPLTSLHEKDLSPPAASPDNPEELSDIYSTASESNEVKESPFVSDEADSSPVPIDDMITDWEQLDLDDTPLSESVFPKDLNSNLKKIVQNFSYASSNEVTTEESSLRASPVKSIWEAFTEKSSLRGTPEKSSFQAPAKHFSLQGSPEKSIGHAPTEKLSWQSFTEKSSMQGPPEKLITQTSPEKTNFKTSSFQIGHVPINWKDAFDPDACSISQRAYNSNKETKPTPPCVREIKKVPVQKVEIQHKPFHLLLVEGEPSVIALEFLGQFTTGKPSISVKVIEMDPSISLYYINKAKNPSILAELTKLDRFYGETEKKTVIKMNKVLLIKLRDIPKCLGVLNIKNKLLLDELKIIADELT